MLKIPRTILNGTGIPYLENAQELTYNNMEPSDTELEDEEISLSSIKDIEWITNAIEPEQQRGPSETP